MLEQFIPIPRIVYFSMEIALRNEIPTYAGSTALVAVNALLLKRTRLTGIHRPAVPRPIRSGCRRHERGAASRSRDRRSRRAAGGGVCRGDGLRHGAACAAVPAGAR